MKILTTLLFTFSVFALVGGERTKDDIYMSQVRIANLCSATHLGKGYFLTAAHCFYTESGKRNNIFKRNKKISIRKYNGKKRSRSQRISEIHIHPTYEKEMKRSKDRGHAAKTSVDMAVIKVSLNRDIFNSELEYEYSPIGKNITLTGTGCDENDNVGTLKIGFEVITYNHIKTKVDTKTHLVDGTNVLLCPGDSGGGLFVNDKVIGVNSAKLKYQGKWFSFFHPVSEVRDWLESIVKK